MPTSQQKLTISQVEARRLALSRQWLGGVRPSGDGEGCGPFCGRCAICSWTPSASWRRVMSSWCGAASGRGRFASRRVVVGGAVAVRVLGARSGPGAHRGLSDPPGVDGRLSPKNLSLTKVWMEANEGLLAHILTRLAEGTPLPTDAFEDRSVMEWPSSGWTAGRNVERMLTFLWLQGRIMVAGREAGRRLWGLPDACLPPGADRVAVSAREMVTTAAEHTLRALGVARPLDIKQYFLRGKYDGLAEVLRTLTRRVASYPYGWRGDLDHRDVVRARRRDGRAGGDPRR